MNLTCSGDPYDRLRWWIEVQISWRDDEFEIWDMVQILLLFAVSDEIQLLSGDTWNISAETNWSWWKPRVHCHFHGSGLCCFFVYSCTHYILVYTRNTSIYVIISANRRQYLQIAKFNIINLLSTLCISKCSHIPTPTNVDWYSFLYKDSSYDVH